MLYMQIGDLGLKPNFLTFAVLLLCHGKQESLAADAVNQVLRDVKRTVSLSIVSCKFHAHKCTRLFVCSSHGLD